MLHSRMISLFDECGIILTNVVEENITTRILYESFW